MPHPASTVANAPMALKIPAGVMGRGGKTGGLLARGDGFDPASAWAGAQMSCATVLALLGSRDVTVPLLDRR